MKNILGTIICTVFLLFCSPEKGIIAYKISEKDLIPEGITFSKTTNSFYLGSLVKAKIIKIDAETGNFQDFTSSDMSGMRFLGMIVDDNRKHLWACGNLTNDSTYISAVLKFDLLSGKLLKSYSMSDSLQNIYNDLVQDERGDVYFTNTNKQTVYKISQETDSVTIFFDGDQILHPNGITISMDFKYLYIASTEYGIRVLDIENRQIVNEPAGLINSTGLDGIKYYKNSIIGIQNEVKDKSEWKIARYFLDETGTKISKMEIIDQNNPHFNIPTTLVIHKNDLYCLANSQMGNVNWNDLGIRHYEALEDIIILKYSLK